MPRDPCSELAKKITELAMHIGARPEVKNLDDVVAHMQKIVPQIERESLVASINEATSGYAKAKDEMGKKLDRMKREARSDVKLRAKIGAMEQALKAGELLPTTKRGTTEPSPSMVSLRERSADLQAALRQSDAAIKQRYLRDIENLTDRLEAGVFTLPEPRAERPMSKDIADLDYQRHQLKQQIQRKLDALKPKTIWGHAAEPFNAARAMMTSMDVSAVLRQGGFIALGNPIRAARELPDMFRALVSERRAYEINKAVFERPNASLYHRDKLFLSEPGFGGLNQQEEAFVSRLAGKLPGVKASERAYVTFLNKLRADSYDAMMEGLARNGTATQAEGEAIANFINVATGRGTLPGAMKQAGPLLNATFFAPRLAISRFQIIAGQPFYGGTLATRKAIAKEYAKFLGGIGVVYGLSSLAGGEIEVDPRSSDFGKIKFGETRLDPLGGLSQAAVLMSRVVTQSSKRADGTIENLDGSGPRNVADVGFDFLRTKFSPLVGAVVNWRAGENVVGEKTGLASEAGRLFVPLSFQDIYTAMQDQGIPKGAALGVLSLFGMGLNTYGPRAKADSKLKELRDAGLGESGIATQIERLRDQYIGADQAGRTRIQAQLDRLNSAATRALNERRKAAEKHTTK